MPILPLLCPPITAMTHALSPYQLLNEHQAVLALWYIVNTSLSAFYKLYHHFGQASTALQSPTELWQALGIHKAHQTRHQDSADVLALVERILTRQAQGAFGVLFVGDLAYPKQLLELYDPPPVLFFQGDVARLSDPQIAIVGSRKANEYATKTTFDMAQYLALSGLTITSGLAQGVDKYAHLGALASTPKGRTVGVMGTGVDVYYPTSHNALYAQILADGGCLVSELLPATPANKFNFPRRNRLIVGLSLATLVTQATLQSGSLISARLCAEQGKQVFAIPSQINCPNSQGCHHLIREGATLVYHPQQILEDLGHLGQTFATPNTPTITPPPQANVCTPIAPHLQGTFDQLTTTPIDLDTLVENTGLDVGLLLGQLLELEMLGLITNTGGRYARL